MIYLDHSATTKVHPEVMESFSRANEHFWANASSLHHFGAIAENVLFKSSRQILDLLEATNHSVIYTSGATESNNLAIKGLAQLNPGGHIITTAVEHPSVLEVCHELEKEGWQVSYLDSLTSEIELLNQLENLVQKNTFLVTCMHVNSEMGLVLPIKKIGELLVKYPRIKFHVDAVQSVGKIPINIDDYNIDLLSLSAHKIYGIKGVGALILKRNLLLKPQVIGGGQMDGIRSGTVNVAGGVSLAKALRLVIENQLTAYERVLEIFNKTRNSLNAIDGVYVNSVFDSQSPYIINFYIEGIKAETMVHALADRKIYISAKSACSSKLQKPSVVMKALGFTEKIAINGLRVSFAQNTTLEEVEEFINAVKIETQKLRN